MPTERCFPFHRECLWQTIQVDVTNSYWTMCGREACCFVLREAGLHFLFRKLDINDREV